MKLSSRETGATGKTCIFESHKPIQIFPSSSTSSVNELLCDTSWVQHPMTWGEEPPSAQERPLGAADSSSCEPQQGCRACSSTFPCNIVRFIFRSYQQFTVGCSVLSKIHPSISCYGHIPASTEVTVQLC